MQFEDERDKEGDNQTLQFEEETEGDKLFHDTATLQFDEERHEGNDNQTLQFDEGDNQTLQFDEEKSEAPFPETATLQFGDEGDNQTLQFEEEVHDGLNETPLFPETAPTLQFSEGDNQTLQFDEGDNQTLQFDEGDNRTLQFDEGDNQTLQFDEGDNQTLRFDEGDNQTLQFDEGDKQTLQFDEGDNQTLQFDEDNGHGDFTETPLFPTLHFDEADNQTLQFPEDEIQGVGRNGPGISQLDPTLMMDVEDEDKRVQILPDTDGNFTDPERTQLLSDIETLPLPEEVDTDDLLDQLLVKEREPIAALGDPAQIMDSGALANPNYDPTQLLDDLDINLLPDDNPNDVSFIEGKGDEETKDIFPEGTPVLDVFDKDFLQLEGDMMNSQPGGKPSLVQKPEKVSQL